MISRMLKLPWQTAGLAPRDRAAGWTTHPLLTALCAGLGVLVALPVLLLQILRGTLPLEGSSFWGVWYQHLTMALLGLAVLLVISLAYRLRGQPWLATLALIAGLFCAWPFLLAIRQNLTGAELLRGQPLFALWPFYLQPLHLLVEIILPLTILAYLLLALQELFVAEERSFAALGAALFLGVAVYIGATGLNQTEQPTLLSRLTPPPAVEPAVPTPPAPAPATVAVSEKTPATPVATQEEQMAAAESLPLPSPPATASEVAGKESPPPSAGVAALILHLGEQVEQLQARVERLETRLAQTPASNSRPPTTTDPSRPPEPLAEEHILTGILRQLENLGNKVDQLGSKLPPPAP